jgi:hypothetical protein
VASAQRIGRTLFLADVRTAYLMVNEARYRAVQGMFRVPRDQVNIITVIVALVLADGLRDRVQRWMKPITGPSVVESLLGAAVMSEVLSGVAGAARDEAQEWGPLLAMALVGAAAAAVARTPANAVRTSMRQFDAGFRNRYGYLVDPGHWRQRRAQRRTSQA